MFSPSVKIVVSCLVTVISITMVTASYPKYLVQLRTKGGHSFCGGALVSKSYVVTAARCIHKMKKEDVEVIGAITNDPELKQRSDIKDWFIPVEFNPSGGTYTIHPKMDIAVIHLVTKLEGEKINTVPMCSEPLKAEDKVKVISWAKPDTPQGLSTTYSYLRIPVISRDECSAKQAVVTVVDTVMCMSEPQSKACAGEIGAPVLLNGKLCGISIMGPGCTAYPGMLTNIGTESVRKFIQNSLHK